MVCCVEVSGSTLVSLPRWAKSDRWSWRWVRVPQRKDAEFEWL